MATVTIAKRPRKNGSRYIVQFVNPETKEKKYYCSCNSWTEADDARDKLKALLKTGIQPEKAQLKERHNSRSFNWVADHCQQDWERRVKEKSLASTTLTNYMYPLKNLRTCFGGKPIGAISSMAVLDYRADLAAEFSPAWSNRHLFVIKQVFQKALKLKVIKSNPAKDINYLSEEEHKRNVFLLPEEIEALLAQARKSRAKHYLPLAILLAVEQGCSKQEILDLKWENIRLDFEETGLISFYRTKNKKDRLHRIMPRTREALLERKAHLGKRRSSRRIKVKDDYVVGHLDGTRMGDLKKAWNTVCQTCGFSDLHFHDNRHTFCTNILLAGGSLKHAGAMIGHKDLRMTDRYTNLEGLRENPIQDLLAAHYQKAKK